MFTRILTNLLKHNSDALCFVLIIGSFQDDEEQCRHTNQSLPIFAQQTANSGQKIIVANFDPCFQPSRVQDGNLLVGKFRCKVPHVLSELQEAAGALNNFISTNVNKKLVIIDHTSPSAYSAKQLYSQLTIKKQALFIRAYFWYHPAIIMDEKTASMTGYLSEHGEVERDVRHVFRCTLMPDEIQLLSENSVAVVNTENPPTLYHQGEMARKIIVDHRATKVAFQNWRIFFSINAISPEHIFSPPAPDAINALVLFALKHPYLTAGIVAALAISAILLTIASCGSAANIALMLGAYMGLTGQSAIAAGTCVSVFTGGGLAAGLSLFATRPRAPAEIEQKSGVERGLPNAY